MPEYKLSPMMRQYRAVKEKYEDCLLFYRLGDFYEMFFNDAITASKQLGLTLTGRDCGLEKRAPMCGVPYRAVNSYVKQLTDKGFKVAICNQMEDPALAKGIVKRDVVRVITPGTVFDEEDTSPAAHYICSVVQRREVFGLAGADVTTGEFFVTELRDFDRLRDELLRLNPREVLMNPRALDNADLDSLIVKRMGSFKTGGYDWTYEYTFAEEKLKQHFKVNGLQGFGIAGRDAAVCSSGALLEYIANTQKSSLTHIDGLRFYEVGGMLRLDDAARRSLELTETIMTHSLKGSLLWVLDRTCTAPGGRLLRSWLSQPLIDKRAIEERHDAVGELFGDTFLSADVKEALEGICDIERLIGKVIAGYAGGRDALQLKRTLEKLPAVRAAIQNCGSVLLQQVYEEIGDFSEMHDLIEAAIAEDCPVSVSDGGTVKPGYNAELDECRSAKSDGNAWIDGYEEKLREETGIKKLKVGFNRVFGYYIEVSKANQQLVPEYFERRQTLASAERYITPELKQLEERVLGAEERALHLEQEILDNVLSSIAAGTEELKKSSHAVAVLDVLADFARISSENGYVRPEMVEVGDLIIKEGRHPVVEQLSEEQFIANDTFLGADERIMILTGPNMAGKSTYLRQVAVIVLMAQMGCFVPANSAHIPIADAIFTRVGASDDLTGGRSTFMVEMAEVAGILNRATKRSLLIMDEIGRGTSTCDGLAIAWATAEHIAGRLGAKALFSTHYHELTMLPETVQGTVNYCMTVSEAGDDVVFLRKLSRGGTDKSFGIHVARLAGVPGSVIQRANQIAASITASNENKKENDFGVEQLKPSELPEVSEEETAAIKCIDSLKEVLGGLTIDMLTPLEAMMTLNRIFEIMREEGQL